MFPPTTGSGRAALRGTLSAALFVLLLLFTPVRPLAAHGDTPPPVVEPTPGPDAATLQATLGSPDKPFRVYLPTVISGQLGAGLGASHEHDDYMLAEAARQRNEPPFQVNTDELLQATNPADLIRLGSWGPVATWPFVAASAANLPDGRILAWGGNNARSFNGGTNTFAAVWDPASGQFLNTPHNDHSMFCAIPTMLEDGRVFVNGGDGTRERVSVFDATTNQWRRLENMNSGRWYPGSVALPSGQVYTALGEPGGVYPEIWTPGLGWRLQTGANLQAPIFDYPGYQNTWLPYLHLTPRGEIFHSGPTPQMNYLDPNGNGAVIPTAARNTWYPKYSATVMYDEGMLLVAGGAASNANNALGSNKAQIIDLRGASPVVTPIAPMSFARKFNNAVMLPNGEVLIVGGNTSGIEFSDQGTILTPEIWNPETRTWRSVADMSVPRNYHSLALLLPDGRVWVGGGGLCNCSADHPNHQIYSPPYLFNSSGDLAVRPTISSVPGFTAAGQSITVEATTGIQRFTLIKMSGITHNLNSDLRFLKVPFTVSSPGQYRLTLQSNVNVLTPGYWMLFAVDANGVPSVASVLQVASNVVSVNAPAAVTNDVGDTINLQVTARSVNPGPLTFSATNLPVGLSINPTTGLITGAIQNAAVSQATISVSDGTGAIGTANIRWTAYLRATGTGEITREWWTGIGGSLINDLTNSPNYPNNPSGSGRLSSFDAPVNFADNYGTRIRGFVYPPMSGQFVFWVAGDDQTRLLLSTDESAANARVIAGVDSWTNPQEWGRFTAQQSAPITLEGGRRYYIEVLHKEGGGGDHLTVAWQIPGGVREVIAGRFLAPLGTPLPTELTLAQLTTNPVQAGTATTFAATTTGGANVRYRWSFGDGSPETALSTSPSAQYTYSRPGLYLVRVTAVDGSGIERVSSATQAVHLAHTATRPVASSSILFEVRTAGNRVWSVNPDGNSVSVIDAQTGALIREIAVGTAPRTLARAADGRIWVANKRSGTISIIDPGTLAVAQTITLPYGSLPYGVLFAPGGGDAYVALEGSGRVIRLNSAGATVASRALGWAARHLAFSADGATLYVSRFISATTTGEATASVQAGQGELVVLSPTDLALRSTIQLGMSTKPDTETGGRGLPNYLGALTLSPDGRSAWIPSKQDNVQRGTLRDGNNLNFQNTVRAISSKIDLATGAEIALARMDHDNASVASAAAFDQSGAYLFVALETNRQVVVVDAYGGRELFRFDVGRAPQGLAVAPDGMRLFVQNFMDRTVTVHDLSNLIRTGSQTVPLVATVRTVAAETLAANVLLGKQLFYDARDPRLALDSYMSCASCHNDGGGDGRVWDLTGFGEGLRNTIDLNGRGNEPGRLHWSGNFDEVQDFERQIRNLAGGRGLLSDSEFNTGTRQNPLGDPLTGVNADLDALAAYVRSLQSVGQSPFRNADGTLTSDALVGRMVFQSAGCLTCHGGAQFSGDGRTLQNVGTIKPSSGSRLNQPLTGLDVPSLRGLWGGGPYLHDGSAATLADAVRAHTNVQVSDADLPRLVAYLLQIDDREPELTVSTANRFRYLKLEVLSDNGALPAAAAAEITVLDEAGQPLNRSGWTARGESTALQPAQNAIDGNPATFWETSWSATLPPPANGLIIDMGAPRAVGGFRYLPRQDGNASGQIRGYRFYLSQDGISWGTPVAEGRFTSGTQEQAAPFVRGRILREWWSGISGGTLASLLGNVNYPYQPTGNDARTSFEAPSNWADNYGTRMRGYLYPPVSGQYTFWIAADDHARLILSTSDDPANGRQIASITGWTNARVWTKYTSQQSVQITLQAGQRYYIEALQKESGGGDNLAVAWQIPGGVREVIAGQYLSPFQQWTVTNLAQGQPATQSSTASGAVASRAVDGNTSGVFNNNSVTQTNNSAQPWWQVDLGTRNTIDGVQLWNRTDCCASRLANFYVFVSDTDMTGLSYTDLLNDSRVWRYYYSGAAPAKLDLPGTARGRYVRIQLSGTSTLALAEVRVWGWAE